MMLPHRKGYTMIEALPLVMLAFTTLASANQMDPGHVIGDNQTNVFTPGGRLVASSSNTPSLSKSGTSVLAPVASCNKFFTVRSGDICFNIWRSYGLSEAQFRALNPGINCNNLQIGERVCVGSGPPTPPGGSQFSGDATWYDDKGYTSCGEYVYGDGDYAAISWPQSDALDSNCRSNPNNCRWCRTRAVVTGPAGSATVRLLDKCQACKFGDIDLTKSIFQRVVGNLGIGRARVSWKIVSAGHSEEVEYAETHGSALSDPSTTAMPLQATKSQSHGFGNDDYHGVRRARSLLQPGICPIGQYYVTCNAPIVCPSPFAQCRADGASFCVNAYNICVRNGGTCEHQSAQGTHWISANFNLIQDGKQVGGAVFCDP
eukprot:jgi/Botrbrau1/11048/Bobra.92_2s0019.1